MSNTPACDFPGFRRATTTRRIVVAGLGSIGRRHTRLLRDRPDVKVEVCEPSKEALERASAQLGDVEVHPDLERALATRPDAIVIATPHSLHAAHAIAGMEAGAHILCEKPLCVDPGEARQMIAGSNRTGRSLVVGFQLHFHPGVRRLRQLIQQGAIGNIVHAHVRVGSFITLRNSLSRYQEALEGALLLDYAHQPDLLLWLLQDLPAGVTLTGLRAGNLPLSSNPNVIALTLDYARPLLATVHLNYIQMPQRHEWEIVGDEGWIVMDADRGTLRLGRRETEAESNETLPMEPDVAYRMEHQAFLDHLDGLREPESPAEIAARSVELYTMALRSWKEDRRVACDWIDYSKIAAAARSSA